MFKQDPPGPKKFFYINTNMKSLRQIILEIAQTNSGGVTAAAPVDSNPPQDGDPDFIDPPSSLKNPPQTDTSTMSSTMGSTMGGTINSQSNTEKFKINQPTSRAQNTSYIEGSAANEASVGLLQRSKLINTQKESAMQIHQRLVQTLRNNQNK